MQLKFAIEEAAPSTARNSTAQYSIVVSCNKCAGVHEMGISVTMENGPCQQTRASVNYTMAGAFQNPWQTLAKIASLALRQADSLPRETTIKSF